ncbi:hypothetical protein VOM14_02005 [Paraburkholderia sp. MPAMCS5]|nr:hypothetical protein [Paraburkholderia sp. MPAMCS5]
MAAQDAQYAPFAACILNLAKGYQSRALLNPVQEQLHSKAAP